MLNFVSPNRNHPLNASPLPTLLTDLPSPDLPRLPLRAADSHKGDYGSGLLMGGSRGMCGAIALAGLATIRAGAGLVRLAVPDRCLETVASYSPCFMTLPLADDAQGRIAAAAFEQLETHLAKADCIAVGPGMGQSAELRTLLSRLTRAARVPLVIDADGLNNLVDVPGWSGHISATCVITPHPGEWSRLSGVPASDRPAQCRAAIEFARSTGSVVVLKGTQTLVTDGRTAVFNSTGTPAMATGGSGDVLTGLITGLICQGLTARDAAHLGVHVHGLAAELAERALSTHVVLPTELIQHVPQAFCQA
jgi:ADP-dependent NAD(P)H-hydrate dehydratase